MLFEINNVMYSSSHIWRVYQFHTTVDEMNNNNNKHKDGTMGRRGVCLDRLIKKRTLMLTFFSTDEAWVSTGEACTHNLLLKLVH